jgi:hypothetical protein
MEEGDFITLIPTTASKANPTQAYVFRYHPRGQIDCQWALANSETGSFKTIGVDSSQKLHGLRAEKYIPVKNGKTHADKFKKHSQSSPLLDRSNIVHVSSLSAGLFKTAREPFTGKIPMSRKKRTLSAIIREISDRDFIAATKKNTEIPRGAELLKLVLSAQRGHGEGQWMNPVITYAALRFYGVPQAFFDFKKKLVPNYNQCIIQVDGVDAARTLGMHQDRDHDNKPVSTFLACIGANTPSCGKEILVWTESSLSVMPTWWRLEGLSRESFEFAKYICRASKLPCTLVTLLPGQFIYMPKSTWHWACPTRDTKWSVMITCSTY